MVGLIPSHPPTGARVMIPNEFKLLNYTWRVVMIDGPVVHADGDQCHGTCDTDARVIRLDATMDRELLWHTWLHELTHAICSALGRSSISADEDFVDSFSGGLAQVYPPPGEQFALTLGK